MNFIDEMDANINDIYFERLIKFFVDYGKGQLIFTTHNTAPMNVLKRVKHGIDFITSDSGIVSWTSNGNYDPQSQYRKGMLIGLPFNVDGFDFLNCFNV